MSIRRLMHKPAAKPVEMKPRLPRERPKQDTTPKDRTIVMVPDDQPLVFRRLNDGELERLETTEIAPALADLRGYAWIITTQDGRPVAMSASMKKVIDAGLEL